MEGVKEKMIQSDNTPYKKKDYKFVKKMGIFNGDIKRMGLFRDNKKRMGIF